MIRLKNIYDANGGHLNLHDGKGVHIIGLYRTPRISHLCFFPAKSGNEIILKEVYHKGYIDRNCMTWTYFSLTDEEVECMIVPRII